MPLRIAGVVGYVEAMALIAYAISILAFEQGGATSGISGAGADLAPGVLVALYLAFAVIVFVVTTGLLRASRRAFTPYLLVQAFGLVVAQPLLGAASTRLAGVVLVAVAALALVVAARARALLR